MNNELSVGTAPAWALDVAPQVYRWFASATGHIALAWLARVVLLLCFGFVFAPLRGRACSQLFVMRSALGKGGAPRGCLR